MTAIDKVTPDCQGGTYDAWTTSAGGGVAGAIAEGFDYGNTSLKILNWSTKGLVTRAGIFVHEAGHWHGFLHDGNNCWRGASCDRAWRDGLGPVPGLGLGGVGTGGINTTEALWQWAFADSLDPRLPLPLRQQAAIRAQDLIDHAFDISPAYRVAQPITGYMNAYFSEPKFQAGEFWDRDFGRWQGDPDWDYGYYKGECLPGYVELGLSKTFLGETAVAMKSVLCQLPDPSGSPAFTGSWEATLAVPGDARRAGRLGDWDYGYWKLECGPDEYVSGTSQAPGSHLFHGVRCSKGAHTFGPNGCYPRLFDVAGPAGDGDWDPANYWKAECAPNEVIAGVSVKPDYFTPHAVLCCPS
jgi:hypothetical protein